MSKFLNLVSKYNGLLNEQDQVDPNEPTIPAETQPVAQEATPEQVSPDVQSEIPVIEPKDLQTFLNALQAFFSSHAYKGEDKQEILNALADKDDMSKLPDTLTNLATKLNPETSLDPSKTVSKDDIQ